MPVRVRLMPQRLARHDLVPPGALEVAGWTPARGFRIPPPARPRLLERLGDEAQILELSLGLRLVHELWYDPADEDPELDLQADEASTRYASWMCAPSTVNTRSTGLKTSPSAERPTLVQMLPRPMTRWYPGPTRMDAFSTISMVLPGWSGRGVNCVGRRTTSGAHPPRPSPPSARTSNGSISRAFI